MSDLFPSDEEVRARIEAEVEGDAGVFDTPEKVEAEVKLRIDEFRWTHLRREDGTWEPWKPF